MTSILEDIDEEILAVIIKRVKEVNPQLVRDWLNEHEMKKNPTVKISIEN